MADISSTSGDAVARAVRLALRKRGVHTGVPVVFSAEPMIGGMQLAPATQRFKRSSYGTASYMPAIFGLHVAAHVIDEVSEMRRRRGRWRATRAVRRAAKRGARRGAGDVGAARDSEAPSSPVLFYDI